MNENTNQNKNGFSIEELIKSGNAGFSPSSTPESAKTPIPTPPWATPSAETPRVNKDAGVTDMWLRTFAILGLLCFLALGSYLIARYSPTVIKKVASAAVSLSSRLISRDDKKDLVLQTSATTIYSGDPITLTWSNETNSEGSYTISYPCMNGVHFETLSRGTTDVVFCNTEYQFINKDNGITLTAFSTQENVSEVPLYLYFTKNFEKKPSVRADATITILKRNPITGENNTTPSPAPRATPQPSPGTPTPRPTTPPTQTGGVTPGPRTDTTYFLGTTTTALAPLFGQSDLTARIIAYGYISTTTREFTASPTINASQTAAVKFDVINQGTNRSGVWKFNAVLPTYPSYIFFGNDQVSLDPGDRIEFVIAFNLLNRQSENTITINVDPQNDVKESNEQNNLIKGIIKTLF